MSETDGQNACPQDGTCDSISVYLYSSYLFYLLLLKHFFNGRKISFSQGNKRKHLFFFLSYVYFSVLCVRVCLSVCLSGVLCMPFPGTKDIDGVTVTMWMLGIVLRLSVRGAGGLVAAEPSLKRQHLSDCTFSIFPFEISDKKMLCMMALGGWDRKVIWG